MSYSPAQYFETSSAPADSHAGMKEFATFLNGTHPTQPNIAGWECIDCFDGTTREQPSGGNLNALSALNKWRADQGTPPQDSWAVFQAPSGGDVAARFQVYVEMTTFQGAFMGIFMLNDWAVGAGTDSNPTIPATSIGVPPFAGGMDSTIANHTDFLWAAVVDEGTIWLNVFPTVAGTSERLYFGDLIPLNPVSLDSRPFIVSRDPDADGFNTIYLHVSLVDDLTIGNLQDSAEAESALNDTQDQDALPRRAMTQVAVYADNGVGDRYWKGLMRNCGAISKHTRAAGSDEDRVTAGIGPTDYTYQVWGSGNTAQVVVIYPPGLIGDSHEQIVAGTVPATLDP